MNWVLDSSAILCWLLGEPGVDRVREVLESSDEAAIHAVNLIEVYYQLLRRGPEPYRRAAQQIEALGLTVVRHVSDGMVGRTVELKAHHAPIALGDVFAVALAMERRAMLLTTDRTELQKIHDAGLCQVEFLR